MPKQDVSHHLPFVSVIIPFYNNHGEVLRIAKSLGEQSYPAARFESIFIDNGSDKRFHFPQSFLDKNTLLKEENYLKSPYSARNRGVEASNGEILAFADANSKPEGDWLEKGVFCLRDLQSELVGGEVKFDFQNKVTAGKIVDALTSVQMEKAISKRGVAYTANLFVRKEVFEKVGLFEEGTRSGGDVRWTLKTQAHGYKIVFCKSSVVKKYARSTKDLYRKKIRTGRGYFYSWKMDKDENKKIWFYNFFRSLKPPSINSIVKLSSERFTEEMNRRKMAVWLHLYLTGIVEQIAFMSEFFRYNLGSRKSEDRRQELLRKTLKKPDS